MTTAIPSKQLQRTLELADAEISAARNSNTLKEARLHAEAVVNIVVTPEVVTTTSWGIHARISSGF